jgi:hypothetical protein
LFPSKPTEDIMAITEADEERNARSRRRQLSNPPLLIRDDGLLYPHTKLVARNPRFRPYHGAANASLEDRMRYLQGLGAKRQVVFNPEPEPFDIGAADVDALLQFAQEQFGVVLDPNKPLRALREHVYNLAQLPDPSLALPDANGGAINASPAVIEAQAQDTAAQQGTRTGGRQPRTSGLGMKAA